MKHELAEYNNGLKSFEGLDLSGGFVCDLETGICGPVDEKEEKQVEEKQNANNNLV